MFSSLTWLTRIGQEFHKDHALPSPYAQQTSIRSSHISLFLQPCPSHRYGFQRVEQQRACLPGHSRPDDDHRQKKALEKLFEEADDMALESLTRPELPLLIRSTELTSSPEQTEESSSFDSWHQQQEQQRSKSLTTAVKAIMGVLMEA